MTSLTALVIYKSQLSIFLFSFFAASPSCTSCLVSSCPCSTCHSVVCGISALLRFNVLPPSTSINRRQPNLPLVSTACARHLSLPPLPCCLPSHPSPQPLRSALSSIKNVLPLKVLPAGQIRLTSSLISAFWQSVPLMKMSFQRLRLRGWEVSDLYVAPLASLSDLLNNQPRRACVPICGLLHPSYIINTSNQVREWKKKKHVFFPVEFSTK